MEVDTKISALLKEVEVLIIKYTGVPVEINYKIHNVFENDPNYLGVKKIIEEEFYVSDLLVKSRSFEYVRARTFFMYWLKHNTNLSLSAIGTKVRKNHATVLYSLRNLNNEFELYPNLKRRYELLAQRINNLTVKTPLL
ncbi:MAG: helix-turn-helix domain-containing protein [Bacteroidia bacterium]